MREEVRVGGPGGLCGISRRGTLAQAFREDHGVGSAIGHGVCQRARTKGIEDHHIGRVVRRCIAVALQGVRQGWVRRTKKALYDDVVDLCGTRGWSLEQIALFKERQQVEVQASADLLIGGAAQAGGSF